jgi:superfamily II DNA helicase RecQ
MTSLNRTNTNGVSLLCIDEAHCLSQWSYNFRPSYLRIRREIQYIQPKSILALTATAGPMIREEIMFHLNVGNDGCNNMPSRRDNLNLYASLVTSEEERLQAIVNILKSNSHSNCSIDSSTSSIVNNYSSNKYNDSDNFIGFKRGRTLSSNTNKRSIDKNDNIESTIIYVGRRYEAESVSDYLKGYGIASMCYHAGMDMEQREKSQSAFNRGSTKVNNY